MKKFLVSFVLFLLSAWAPVGVALAQQASGVRTVAVTAIVEHPALDAVRDGILERLNEAGYQEGEGLNFIYESAQGSPATAKQIADRFIGLRPDVMVGIATPSAQALVATDTDLPIIFSAVTDPVGAGIVKRMRQPGGNVTGVSDPTPIDKHLQLVKQLVPQGRSVGVIYNSGEANSVSLLKLIRQHAPSFGLEIHEAVATKSSEVLSAAQSLVEKVDVFYIPTDNTAFQSFEAIVQVADLRNVPVVAGDTNAVPRGAVAASGFDYKDVGRETGAIVLRVLDGESPGSIDATTVQSSFLVLNEEKAAQIGLYVSQTLRQQAASE